jgi:hypothetical protein
MPDELRNSKPLQTGTIRDLLEPAPISVKSVADYISAVKKLSELWQEEDWKNKETDPDYELNNARIVGRVWFRGHKDPTLSLRPGLYRDSTWTNLRKQPGSPSPEKDKASELFTELFEIEHDQRIDFTSYGHLLNQANQAKSAIDWYFLMQHHGVPTRLLDWSTNALAALFFALDSHRRAIADAPIITSDATAGSAGNTVAVWMIDAYWLARHLNEEWYAPLLPWSEDAARYVPPLEKLIDESVESRALMPHNAMPIEPPAMHPRVAAQEGRFVIFGVEQDLLEQRIRLERDDDCKLESLRVAQVRVEAADIESQLRDLAQLGVSSRTLFPDLTGLADFVKWKHFHKVGGYNLEV